MTDEEIFEQIEKFAALAMSPRDIELILGLHRGRICGYLKFSSDKFAEAYHKGKLILESEINKSIINLAKQGSGPAQSMAKKLMDEQSAKEVDFE